MQGSHQNQYLCLCCPCGPTICFTKAALLTHQGYRKDHPLKLGNGRAFLPPKPSKPNSKPTKTPETLQILLPTPPPSAIAAVLERRVTEKFPQYPWESSTPLSPTIPSHNHHNNPDACLSTHFSTPTVTYVHVSQTTWETDVTPPWEETPKQRRDRTYHRYGLGDREYVPSQMMYNFVGSVTPEDRERGVRKKARERMNTRIKEGHMAVWEREWRALVKSETDLEKSVDGESAKAGEIRMESKAEIKRLQLPRIDTGVPSCWELHVDNWNAPGEWDSWTKVRRKKQREWDEKW